ncbi:cytochrome c oxidase subunit II [Planococcus lenghuensis]|uniref:Cytochrome c oxidase subunit 2 n=1 Tax=Planococcus lenghuensis TaxID=2213202 RepID=A0A1Q2L1A7_9BACL|nr:cytochrome c oxidase subunit II [Planococcus lenghuensis]AQQ53827.1 cytochrome c oxidase subunit II [Planococcus lenghuensis]
MMKGLKKWRLFGLLAALTAFLAGCGEEQISILQPAGQVAEDQYDLLLLSTGVMVFVILVVTIIYVLAIVKFRRKKVGDDFMPEQVEGSQRLEFLWTAIPIAIVLFLAVPTVAITYQLEDVDDMGVLDAEGTPASLTVDVTAKLYWWEFAYPDLGIYTAQELVVPADETVYFNLTAADVKHSFWVPSIGGKVDANVDGVNTFYLTFDEESADLEDGVFYGKCAELCGPSHALMDFKVKVLSEVEFNAWVAAMQESTGDVAEAGELAEAGQDLFEESCIACHAVSGAQTTGGIAPNLATFGDRNRIAGFLPHSEENLIKWISEPQEYKPGNLMPDPGSLPGRDGEGFTEEELNALAAYLFSLTVEEEQD